MIREAVMYYGRLFGKNKRTPFQKIMLVISTISGIVLGGILDITKFVDATYVIVFIVILLITVVTTVHNIYAE